MSLAEDLLESADLVDRCVVCHSERSDRMRRTISAEIGGAAASANFTIEYCADDSRCGEARALNFIDTVAATFIAEDLARHRIRLMDLGIPEGAGE